MADALDGLIDAHVAALRVQAADGAHQFAVGVANDTLEVAATAVGLLPEGATRQGVMDVIRGLKRGAVAPPPQIG